MGLALPARRTAIPASRAFLTPSIRAADYSGAMRTATKVSISSFLVCIAIVVMAVVNQYLSGQT